MLNYCFFFFFATEVSQSLAKVLKSHNSIYGRLNVHWNQCFATFNKFSNFSLFFKFFYFIFFYFWGVFRVYLCRRLFLVILLEYRQLQVVSYAADYWSMNKTRRRVGFVTVGDRNPQQRFVTVTLQIFFLYIVSNLNVHLLYIKNSVKFLFSNKLWYK